MGNDSSVIRAVGRDHHPLHRQYYWGHLAGRTRGAWRISIFLHDLEVGDSEPSVPPYREQVDPIVLAFLAKQGLSFIVSLLPGLQAFAASFVVIPAFR